MPAPAGRPGGSPTSGAGLALPDACALLAALFSASWPIAQALSGAGQTLAVAVPFALVLAFGFAFIGVLFGKVLERLMARGGRSALRVPLSVAAILAVAAFVLGVWFGRGVGA